MLPPMDTLTLGRFALDRQGRLRPRAPHQGPTLRFVWRGHLCEARVTETTLILAAEAARIPSTAQSGADRQAAFAALDTVRAGLPPGRRLRLLPDHRIRLEAEVALSATPTVVTILAGLVRFARTLDPYLDALAAGTAGTSGTANT